MTEVVYNRIKEKYENEWGVGFGLCDSRLIVFHQVSHYTPVFPSDTVIRKLFYYGVTDFYLILKRYIDYFGSGKKICDGDYIITYSIVDGIVNSYPFSVSRSKIKTHLENLGEFFFLFQKLKAASKKEPTNLRLKSACRLVPK